MKPETVSRALQTIRNAMKDGDLLEEFEGDFCDDCKWYGTEHCNPCMGINIASHYERADDETT